MKVVDGKKGITADMCFDSVPTRGRPMKKLNDVGADIVRKLAAVMCTEEEIASVLEVSVEVLHNKLNDRTFSEYYKSGKEEGKASLRRTQFEIAKKNATMAIWLGKQYLGQTDDAATKEEARTNGLEITFAVEDVSGGDDENPSNDS